MDKITELKLNHKLEIIRICVDKAFFGILLIVGAFLANYTIERYKAAETTQQFLLEERLKNVREILNAHSNTTGQIYTLLEGYCKANNEVSSESKEKIINSATEFTATINKHSILFSDSFEQIANRTLNIHLGIAATPQELKCNTRLFLNSISEYFEHQIQLELGITTGVSNGVAPVEITKAKLDEIGYVNYLIENLSNWNDGNG